VKKKPVAKPTTSAKKTAKPSKPSRTSASTAKKASAVKPKTTVKRDAPVKASAVKPQTTVKRAAPVKASAVKPPTTVKRAAPVKPKKLLTKSSAASAEKEQERNPPRKRTAEPSASQGKSAAVPRGKKAKIAAATKPVSTTKVAGENKNTLEPSTLPPVSAKTSTPSKISKPVKDDDDSQDVSNENLKSARKGSTVYHSVKIANGEPHKPYLTVPGDDPTVVHYNQMSLSELKDELRLNHGFLVGSREQLIQRCVDGSFNGAIGHCPVCKVGRIKLDVDGDFSYFCGGYYVGSFMLLAFSYPKQKGKNTDGRKKNPLQDTGLAMYIRCPFRERHFPRLPWRLPGSAPVPGPSKSEPADDMSSKAKVSLNEDISERK